MLLLRTTEFLGSSLFATDVLVTQKSLHPLSRAAHQVSMAMQVCTTLKRPFNATVAPIDVRPTCNTACGRRLQPLPLQFAQYLCWARSTSRFGQLQEPLNVAHEGSSKVKRSSRA